MWVTASCAAAVGQGEAPDSESVADASRRSRRGRSSTRSASVSPTHWCAPRNRRSTLRRVGTHSADSVEGEEGYDAHLPIFPNGPPPSSIVLEPYPNRRVQSLCTAGGLLVTAHRNGIRIFRQRYLSGEGNSTADVRTGLWELVEVRGDFYLHDAYLCDAAEQVFSCERVLPVKWNRYVAAACGSDRTQFSVCVLSTAARFLLHHELHGRNKIVALHFALIPMESNVTSRRFQPFVVSVDEVGEVAIYHVERDYAVKLRESEEFTKARGRSASGPPLLCGTMDNNCAESSSHLRVYRLEAGLASRISLVGPCQVLCARCGNETVTSSGMIMSLFVTSHANSAEGQAELHIQHLRFFWCHSPMRAILLTDDPIVRERAPESVCELGAAALRVPFHRSLPTRFMIARPRLRFWSLSGCTGKLLHLHRIYRDTDGSGKGARSVREYFVHVVPLGRHILARDPNTSWLCCAALTDDNVVLLLGQGPAPAGRGAVESNKNNTDNYAGEDTASQRRNSVSDAAAEERRVVEAWLDDAEAQGDERRATKDDIKVIESDFASVASGDAPPGDSSAPPPSGFADPKDDFTVLMVLAAPRNSASDVARPIRGRELHFLPQSSELLLFLGQTESFLSVRLPFAQPTVPPPPPPAPRRAADPSDRSVWGAWGGGTLDIGIARPLLSVVAGLAGAMGAGVGALPQVRPQPVAADVSVAPAPHSPLQSQTAPVTRVHVHGAVKLLSPPRHRIRRRGRRAGSAVSVEDRLSGFGRREDEGKCEDARRAYVRGEHQKLLEARQRHIVEDVGSACAVAVAQLLEMEEPLQRNTIAYTWSDEHDAMYVRHIQETLGIAERARCDKGTSTAARMASECSVRNRFAVGELHRGCHSAGFMQAHRHAQRCRQSVAGHGGVFDFSAYFADGIIPPWLIGLQEDDRCRFELADLRAAFEDDMRQFTKTDTVVVYENEERIQESNGRRRWMPHNTFPFDDTNGQVIDMNALNATASVPTAPSEAQPAAGWRWASDAHVTDKVVRKELRAWSIGEWQYAARWPTREEEANSSFHWSEKTNAEAKVRRRRITRVRVNIAVEAAMEARRQEYEREEEKLRAELGL